MSLPGSPCWYLQYLHIRKPQCNPPFFLFQVLLLLSIADWMVHSMWRSGKDPDSFSIPYLTALGDLLGTALLALSFHFLWVIGDQDSDVGDWGGLWQQGVCSDRNPAVCHPTSHALKPWGNMGALYRWPAHSFVSLQSNQMVWKPFSAPGSFFYIHTKDIQFDIFRLFSVQISICIVCTKALAYYIAGLVKRSRKTPPTTSRKKSLLLARWSTLSAKHHKKKSLCGW